MSNIKCNFIINHEEFLKVEKTTFQHILTPQQQLRVILYEP